jgi:hypothetical protein
MHRLDGNLVGDCGQKGAKKAYTWWTLRCTCSCLVGEVDSSCVYFFMNKAMGQRRVIYLWIKTGPVVSSRPLPFFSSSSISITKSGMKW